ncbi:L-threonylcarbamoyladenylate synthase type 1 TsaC [Candidatus Pantoea edessiphila]|uniref:Threonylcarbamoyl-AMP synthase n=1 Tax=Candidatus Pantoea edessiphila TaxID=2044610 RepID=A0A2P5T1W2_9GAMM|nr:Sua5/YciO/YrdC/YwlC family protein [Candidatus Pantoea edessiphila]PPI88568.1 L-threonylcarbamoyladenylate synthase type 1 TsaC [Candidatus Pantoea edessiphila]
MHKEDFLISLKHCVKELYLGGIIIYPTEAVFGFGCDPENKTAVEKLIFLKNRSLNKGFILISNDYNQLKSYVDEYKISSIKRDYMFSYWPGPTTFIVPASRQTPIWLTGKFDSLAIRVSNHPGIKALCNKFGKPIISTSANLANQKPCRTFEDVIKKFGKSFPILLGETYGLKRPSEIRNIITGDLIRKG